MARPPYRRSGPLAEASGPSPFQGGAGTQASFSSIEPRNSFPLLRGLLVL